MAKSMNFISICCLFLLIFKLIRCELNTTFHLFIPNIFAQSNPNSPLSEQAIYDLRNNLRLSQEIVDFDDEESMEDAAADDDEGNPIEISSSATELLHPLPTASFRQSSSIRWTIHWFDLFVFIVYFHLI